MYEVVGNLHMHTTLSDGWATHDVVAASAIRAGLDFIIFTDHNVWAGGVAGYYEDRRGRRVLALTGEEAHDTTRRPQCNHLLVYGMGRSMARQAQAQPSQALIDAVSAQGGLSFLAHPQDVAVPWAGEPPIPWENRDVTGFTGLELWNYMSSTKSFLSNFVAGLFNVYDPSRVMTAPYAEVLAYWDDLLMQGRRVAVIGSADAHGTLYKIGPVQKVIYRYEYLFRCVNTHVLLPEPLAGDVRSDEAAIYQAIARGNAFVGYSIPADPRSFSYVACRADGTTAAIMGDETPFGEVAMLRADVPTSADLRLIHNGQAVAQTQGRMLAFRPQQPGAYRVEAWKPYRGRPRGWIFGNPIYLRA